MAQLPRRCPLCERDTIIGHGRRRKQAHDRRHDWIWVRRGKCPPCRKTFTVLPTWSPPSGHYSYECRQQASEATGNGQQDSGCLDAERVPDESTVRRWKLYRTISFLAWLVAFGWGSVAATFFSVPTILAWDWPAARRILRLEANSP